MDAATYPGVRNRPSRVIGPQALSGPWAGQIAGGQLRSVHARSGFTGETCILQAEPALLSTTPNETPSHR
jgi:hypothetical protein